ncbi:zinc finger and BTB domain-containing protein 17-like isoform X4 [Lineus longissimus]|uniref:zinc finger and BTB domain-containing protein 17-like isoform X4 n=1 Tax=Lineus longissimus TaxID=88925 RepID=UPI002B4E22D8
MERRKRSANQEPVIVLDEEEKMEPIHKLLKLDRDKVKTIQSEMRTKGLVLSQTWSDLYSLMSRYQAELITREDQLIDIESQLDAQRNIARDNELERMKLQMQAKDREIKTIHMDMLNKSELLVKTQNELGRVKCLLRSKDDLIRKLQCEVKVEEDSVMAGDSPAEQVSTKTATSATSSSGTGTDTSSLIIEQTHLEEHVQTNFSRSGSDDSGTGAEKTDAKYQVSSSNDEETDSFLPLESDVATINIPGQDSGVLEEVQPGTSATDDTGQVRQPNKDPPSTTSSRNESFTITKSLPTPEKHKPIKPWRKDHLVTPYSHTIGLHSIYPRSRVPVSQIGIPEFRPRAAWDFLKKEHKCSHCGKVFSRNYNLQRHIRIMHRGDRPYGCHICGRRFSLKHNWQKHTMTHHLDEAGRLCLLEQEHDEETDEMSGQCKVESPESSHDSGEEGIAT